MAPAGVGWLGLGSRRRGMTGMRLGLALGATWLGFGLGGCVPRIPACGVMTGYGRLGVGLVRVAGAGELGGLDSRCAGE